MRVRDVISSETEWRWRGSAEAPLSRKVKPYRRCGHEGFTLGGVPLPGRRVRSDVVLVCLTQCHLLDLSQPWLPTWIITLCMEFRSSFARHTSHGHAGRVWTLMSLRTMTRRHWAAHRLECSCQRAAMTQIFRRNTCTTANWHTGRTQRPRRQCSRLRLLLLLRRCAPCVVVVCNDTHARDEC